MAERKNLEFDLAVSALERWRPLSLVEPVENEIRILEPVGEDFFGGGVTAAAVADDLRRFGPDAPVTVLLNTPGGSFDVGLAIYNMLAQHRGPVTAKVLGIAASAGSVIAMAADELQIGREAFLMMHRSWAMVIGNAGDMREFAGVLDQFDASMRNIYSRRSGETPEKVAELMAAETWLSGPEAVSAGFADAILGDAVEASEPTRSTAHLLRRVESALRRDGMSRAEARRTVATLHQSAPDQQDRLDTSMAEAREVAFALESVSL